MPSQVRITIYDLSGRTIEQLMDEKRAAGEHVLRWDANDREGNPLSAGVYLYTIHAGDFAASRKMILLR
jgi:flagellar hook assembly protein FlgD